jgi:cell division protein FtsN
MIGIFISFLVYLRQVTPEKVTPAQPIATAPAEASAAEKEASATARFEFYDLLPEAKLNVPDASSEPQAMPTTDAVTSPAAVTDTAQLPAEETVVTTPGRYILQVGSFRNQQEAEGLKNHLSSLGIQAYIELVSTQAGEPWHRVRVGPFENLATLNQTRTLLAENNIYPILLKF